MTNFVLRYFDKINLNVGFDGQHCSPNRMLSLATFCCLVLVGLKIPQNLFDVINLIAIIKRKAISEMIFFELLG